MVVYADVLFFLNSVIDYFLISITSVLLKVKIKTSRQILASLLGGVSSFYIFIENNNFLIDISYRMITATVIVFSAFSYKYFTFFVKTVSLFFASSILLFGLMFILYRQFSVSKIIINNTFFYFNFSPLLAIFLTIVTYVVIKLVRKFSNQNIIPKECVTEFNIGNNFVSGRAYIDTGNIAKDYFSDSELCFISKELFFKFTGCNTVSGILKTDEYKSRYRTIPITTLNETSLLDGLRCDNGKIYLDKKTFILHKPIVVISNNLPSNFDVIISAKVLEKTPENILKGDTIETI